MTILICPADEPARAAADELARVIRELGVMTISQFGFVCPLPARTRSVELDPLTGAQYDIIFSEK